MFAKPTRIKCLSKYHGPKNFYPFYPPLAHHNEEENLDDSRAQTQLKITFNLSGQVVASRYQCYLFVCDIDN